MIGALGRALRFTPSRRAGGVPATDGNLQPAWVASRSRLYIVAGLVFIVLALASAIGMAAILRAAALGDARRNLDRLSAAMAEQVSQSLQTVDIALEDVALRVALASAGRPAAMGGDGVKALLAERLRSAGSLSALTLVDADGKVVTSTAASILPTTTVQDREYFKALRDHPSIGLFVSKPMRGRGRGEWMIVLARRLTFEGAGFHGLVVGAMPLETIEASFAQMAATPGGAVTLRRDDGTVVARMPNEGSPDSPGAQWQGRSKRLTSSHHVGHDGLWIDVSVTQDAALETWRLQAISILLLTVAATGCIVFMLWGLTRQFRAQHRIRQALARRNLELEHAQTRLQRQASELEATAVALRGGEKLLAERSSTLSTTLQYIDQGIMMVDANNTVAVYNQRVVEMLGLPDELLSTHPPFSAVLEYQWASGEFERTTGSVVDLVRSGGMRREPHVYQRERPNGQVLEIRSLPLPGGGIVRTYSDITERKRSQARIEHAALFDELTGLANRMSFREELERRLADSIEAEGLAVLYLNLDRFRLLNDARGHEVGDQVLIETARRLTASVPPGSVVGRAGGDEFAVLHSAGSAPNAAALGKRLLQVLSEPHSIGDVRLAVGVSIGIATAPPGASTDTVLRNADIAMYRAKDGGRNQIREYEPAMAVAQQERFHLEQSLREALAAKSFRMAYQPIVSLENDSIAGYEALLRWTDDRHGEILPSVFIPVAEAIGLIVPLGRLALEWACFEAASWTNARTVAVNLSPAQFHDDRLIETVRDVLYRSGLAPERLEFEVTEGMLLENTQSVLDTMRALREIGVALTLDDFGTGHAGLSSLRRFPFGKIKIDRSFVANLGNNRESDAIVEAVLFLGARLNLRVVAEGVEFVAQLEHLRRMHCPFVQGYLTGRPTTPEIARAL